MPICEPRTEHPLGHWRGAASIPSCTWPSPPRKVLSTAGLERVAGWRGVGLGHTGSEGAIGAQGQGQMQGQGQGQGQGQEQGKGRGKG